MLSLVDAEWKTDYFDGMELFLLSALSFLDTVKKDIASIRARECMRYEYVAINYMEWSVAK